MSEAKFTPGPWRWEHDEDTGDPRVYAMQRENKLRERLVCLVGHYGDDPDMEANAALIAAAPEMHDELTQARRDVEILLAMIDGAFDEGEMTDDPDDLSILSEIKTGYATPSAALAKVGVVPAQARDGEET